MTQDDKRPFVAAFNALAVAVRLTDADATMQRIYWQGLSDLELAHVQAGAERLSKSASWFPKLAEWRAAAHIASIASMKALSSGREKPWEEECGACADTGWEARRCYSGTRNTCGRRKCEQGRPEHGYVSPCACRQTNRTFQRHHALKEREEYAS